MYTRCATGSICPERGCCSSLSMARRMIRTCRRTTTPIQYTGTHDNPTTREWCDELPASQRQFLWRYLKRTEGRNIDVASALIELAWSSAAALAIVPLQDMLNLGAEARMNVP